MPPSSSDVSTSPSNGCDFERLIAEVQHSCASVATPSGSIDRPTFGQTLYLAQCKVDMEYGTFRAYVFQDLIDKHYIIALAHGDIVNAPVLYTRVHSSCLTSETLRACDCDCVQQLDGAIKRIAQKGNGLLFYLLQEGRGVGYVGKARDRMLVQASGDRISTFQAYAALGLEKDHRRYDNIAHICHLLGIKAPFIVLTNNPDKVAALKNLGIQIAGTEALEFDPSPFNVSYLTSKAAAGHILSRPTQSLVRRAVPPEPVRLFKPHALPHAQRFIYAASYYLPMRPVDNQVLLPGEHFRELFQSKVLGRLREGPRPLIRGYEPVRGFRYLISVDTENLAHFKKDNPQDPIIDLLSTPYWFRVHAYYDIVTNQDFVVLTHGAPSQNDAPIVRLHSEALFNRFPLKSVENRAKFEQTVRHIVTYGSGVILLLHNDGRGAGFGAYATDKMLEENGVTASSDEAYKQIGVEFDSRDYDASVLLLKHHLPGGHIQMVMNSPDSLVSKTEYAEALKKYNIDVENWIFLETE